MSDQYTQGQQITVRDQAATVFAQIGNAVIVTWNSDNSPGVVTVSEIDKKEQSS